MFAGEGKPAARFLPVTIFILTAAVLSFDARAELDQRVHSDGGLKIAATIFPLVDIGKHIAGKETEIVTILPAGANPHTFELAPHEVRELEKVQIVFMIGRGFDDWVRAIGESLPEIKILAVDGGINLIGTQDDDPHYWLSIANAKIIARNMALALIELDPDRKSVYQANLESYVAELEKADEMIKQMLLSLPTRKIITFHDGWRYFARDYGLEILGNVESSQGSEPTPRSLARLQETARQHQIKVLFSEPAVSKEVAKSLAQDLGLFLYELDPIGTSSAQSYLDLMMKNARVIHEALTHE